MGLFNVNYNILYTTRKSFKQKNLKYKVLNFVNL